MHAVERISTTDNTPISTAEIIQTLSSEVMDGTTDSLQGVTDSPAPSASIAQFSATAGRTAATSSSALPGAVPVLSFAYGAPLTSHRRSPARKGRKPQRGAGMQSASAAAAAEDDDNDDNRSAGSYASSRRTGNTARQQQHRRNDGSASSPRRSIANDEQARTQQRQYDDDGRDDGNHQQDLDESVVENNQMYALQADVEPAAVRYARLKQRLKDTGSSRPPPSDRVDYDHTKEDISQIEDAHIEQQLDRAGDDSAEQQEEDRQQQHHHQRGHGPGVFTESLRPKDGSSKDTSVNIATAFRQAARTVRSGSTTLQQSVSVGFLSRAGDRDTSVPLAAPGLDASASYHQDSFLDDGSMAGGVSATSNSPERGPQDYAGSPLNEALAASPNTSGSREANAAAHAGATARAGPGEAQPVAGQKRKKKTPAGLAYRGSVSEKDSAFKITQRELNEVSSDELLDEEDEDVDLEELRSELGFGTPSRPAKSTASSGVKPTSSSRKKARKATLADEPANSIATNEETARKRGKSSGHARRRSSTMATDGTYKPGTEDEDSDEDRGHGRRRRQSRASTKGRDQRADSAVSDTDGGRPRDASLDPSIANSTTSTNGQHGLTSFYLHAPSEEPEGAPARPSTTQHRPLQPTLTQTQPKTQTYQPFFAYSTAAGGSQAGMSRSQSGHGLTSLSRSSILLPGTSALRGSRDQPNAREASVPSSSNGGETESTSARQDALDPNDSKATRASSNASFDQRGSDYDYATEERMLAELRRQKEQHASTGASWARSQLQGIPEGRPFSHMSVGRGGPLSGKSALREQSIDPSELSLEGSENSGLQPVQRTSATQVSRPLNRLIPRRVSQSASREASVASDDAGLSDRESASRGDHTSVNTHINRPRPKFGRQLGELLRKLVLLACWITVGCTRLWKKTTTKNLLKTTGLVALAALMIASMQERASVHQQATSSRWPLPFSLGSRQKQSPLFSAPQGTPGNLDELVARLTNLEGSFSSLTRRQESDHTRQFEADRQRTDALKRLALLEADYEADRRRAAKTVESSRKEAHKEAERLESSLKGVKTQLDHLSEKVKTMAIERKQDALDAAKLRSDVSTIDKDLVKLNRRVSDLHTELITVGDGERLARAASKAIEEMLPSRLAVAIDPKTGQVQIDPKFWQHLQSAFASSGTPRPGDAHNSQSAASASSWEDFLMANRRQLERLISEDVDNRMTRGAVLTRKVFTELLERELVHLRADLSAKTSDDLNRLSRELALKMDKLQQQSSARVSAKTGQSGSASLNSLDVTVREAISAMIDVALDRYSKDLTAKPDFALYTSGARVIPYLTSPTYEIRPRAFLGSLISRTTGGGIVRGKPPVTALHPDISVGQCWTFAGQSGQLGILLSRSIVPSDIIVEHASKDLALDITSAPKAFEVWGLIENPTSRQKLREAVEQQRTTASETPLVSSSGREIFPSDKTDGRIFLLHGEYDALNGDRHIQAFPVEDSVRSLGIPIDGVVLRFLSNHGNENLTCVYRVRVGGEMLDV